uniref:Uncharacterized protein n=1 Tax=Chromera velia CCMP2878 TaxID=1169474 RepID=A0A0G4HMZ6_9ALVE|eukprot:Cvel_7543.t1-p1 / transcript=Cvel_7543.t1 / gene=Cvel_7543 / organism=Chromera_velia_CCMP2878 / gene_product=hypothetical protein / transcript_product=hypothetical protein / location=Cvel_scaffold396:71775-72623(+) / protein_length=283 / sequence_SO=supercontig / SO=protein_coding / is_pseudo=false
MQSLLQTVPPGPIPNTPLPPDSRDRPDDSPALPASQARSFRSLLGGLAWVAQDTRPDLVEACNELSRSVACLTERSLSYLHGAVHYAAATKHRTLYIRRDDTPKRSEPLDVTGWGDAALGTAGCAHPHPHTGWLIAIRNSLIHWRSFRQPRIARSSARAELYALHDLVDFMEFVLPCLWVVWGEEVSDTVHTDAQDVLHLVAADHPHPREWSVTKVIESLQEKLLERSLSTLVIQSLALRDALDVCCICLYHISTDLNRADPLTKNMAPTFLLPFFSQHIPDE